VIRLFGCAVTGSMHFGERPSSARGSWNGGEGIRARWA